MPRSPVRPRPSRLYRPCAGHRAAAPFGVGWSRPVSGSSACRADEVEAYLESAEWRGKAGGYAIQGLAGAFVERLVGSYSNVVGLPLAETVALLGGQGYHVHGAGARASFNES